MQLRILPEVWEDLQDAADWYDRIGGHELGDRVIEAFRSQLPDLLSQAGTHRLVYKKFSRVFAKPFPYAIYFRIDEDSLVVTLFWHTARNPLGCMEALDERDQC